MNKNIVETLIVKNSQILINNSYLLYIRLILPHDCQIVVIETFKRLRKLLQVF
jgi:hypothetical protein